MRMLTLLLLRMRRPYREHNNPLGSCSDFALIDALKPKKKSDANKASTSWDDYDVPTDLPENLKNKVACVDLVNFA